MCKMDKLCVARQTNAASFWSDWKEKRINEEERRQLIIGKPTRFPTSHETFMARLCVILLLIGFLPLGRRFVIPSFIPMIFFPYDLFPFSPWVYDDGDIIDIYCVPFSMFRSGHDEMLTGRLSTRKKEILPFFSLFLSFARFNSFFLFFTLFRNLSCPSSLF